MIDLEETDDLLAEEEAAATEVTDEPGVLEELVLLNWHPAQELEEAAAIEEVETLVTKLLLASQAGQNVDVDVMVRVDTVLNTEVTGVPPDDMVEVTGQVVVVSYATTVVVEPAAEEVSALVLPYGMTGLLDVGVTEELAMTLDPNPEEAELEGIELTEDPVGVDPTGKDPDGRDPEAVAVIV